MRRSLFAVVVGLSLIWGTACGSTTTPAAVTTTITPAQVTVKTTATTTATVTSKVTATAQASGVNLSDVQVACALALRTFGYIDEVKANFDKNDGTAPFSFLQKVVSDAYDTLDDVNSYSLDEVQYGGPANFKAAWNLWKVAVIGLKSASSSTDGGFTRYLSTQEYFKTTCMSLL